MSLVPEIVEIATRVLPAQATLVPERRQEITTEGGLDLSREPDRVAGVVNKLKSLGVTLSAFIDPVEQQIELAGKLGFDAVELHTGRYANSWRQSDSALEELRQAARHAVELGLFVHAGHGLTYANVLPVAQIPEIEELNIGHSVMSRAILLGMHRAVTDMRQAMVGSLQSGVGSSNR